MNKTTKINSTNSYTICNNKQDKSKQPAHLNYTFKNTQGYIQKDTFDTQNKKNKENIKKNKTALFAISGAVILGVAGIILGGKFIPKNTYKKVGDFVQTNGKKVGEGTKNIFTKASNAFLNFTSMKDSYLKKIYPKVKPLQWLDEKSSSIYRKGVSSTINGAFSKLGKKIEKSSLIIKNVLKSTDKSKLGKIIKIGDVEKTAQEWIDDVIELSQNQSIDFNKSFNKCGIQSYFDKIDDSLKNAPKEFREVFRKTIKSKESRKQLFDFMAEDMVANQKLKFNEKLLTDISNFTNGSQTGSIDKISEIMKSLSENQIIDQKTYDKKLAPMFNKIKNSMQKNGKLLGGDAFDKLRDINIGCAPTDVMFSDIGGLTMLGIYTAQAKTKEERTSVALTTAVPLGLGMAGLAYSTIKMKSGIKGMLIGSAISLGSSIIGKSLDKIYRKKHNMNDSAPSIPTIELPSEIADSKLIKKVDDVVATVVE